ncbi:type II toxin-antitoxin system antitoxin SocA domain-containing protein [Spongiibacter sp.]|uniref:Panacea domain-containing protein n=1 Tax=Spongiibacter sp. TaxID=2024860 RepID=UPI000C407DFA|nr:type II toxin-antitoxin system antitoxin SocA domain-containing protein [Spongiibacter sp.]MBU71296.1 hypothetical protein [Spongiibacter sp.]|tara:strand:- start:409 stop:981 length:573 start_codon:yes stop_codon:yes gene_type:complete
MTTFQDVSAYILHLADRAGIQVSNLKLQKLVYYCQGFSLGVTGKPLFDEEIVAWEHGPVVEPLYHQYKQFGKSPIPAPSIFQFNEDVFDDIQQDLIADVVNVFGREGAWSLREMTHKETTWLAHSADGKSGDGTVITKEELATFFRGNMPDQDYFDSFVQSANSITPENLVQIPDAISTAEDFVAWLKKA